MKRAFFRQPLAFVYLLASVAPLPGAYAKPAMSTRAGRAEKPAVLRALGKELGQQTSGHVRVMAFTVTHLDIDSGYALAKVHPTKPADLDPISVLMHKQKGQWKFVTLGTSLSGAGKQYGVPHKLWAKWALK